MIFSADFEISSPTGRITIQLFMLADDAKHENATKRARSHQTTLLITTTAQELANLSKQLNALGAGYGCSGKYQ